MAFVVVVSFVLLAMMGQATCNWCVCNPSLPEATLQKTLDYACGAGADCGPIHQNGACYMPDTVKSHCNYAVNSFFQKKGQAQGTCDFTGTAMLATSDPSYSGCSFPSSLSASGTNTTPLTTTPTTGGPVTHAPPTNFSPYTMTPTNGGVGGINGVGPTGVGAIPDINDGGLRISAMAMGYLRLGLVVLITLWAII